MREARGVTPEIREAARLAAASKKTLVFTGAGISTASGIPDFRGPGGEWTKREPVLFHEFEASHDSRVAYWRYKSEGFDAFRAAKPNAAHLALAAFEKTGRLWALVTQNIDNLHRLAGTSNGLLVELHGSGLYAECLDCMEWVSMEEAIGSFRRSGEPPACKCGGFLKPGVVMFGESMPQGELMKAFAKAASADLVVSIGSTLQVQPASSVPARAREAGAKYIIVNRGPTAHDRIADIRIEGDAASVVPEIFGA